MNDTLWIRTDNELPPEGFVVQTISPGGIEGKLKRKGRIWLLPDDSMYMYYTPMFWKPLT